MKPIDVENIIWDVFWNYDLMHDLCAEYNEILEEHISVEFTDTLMLVNLVYNSLFNAVWDDIG